MYPISHDNLLLAVLSNHVKLNKNRLDYVLNCYPDITNAVEDSFHELFKPRETKLAVGLQDDQCFESDTPDNNNFFKLDRKWLSTVQSFDWSKIEECKQETLLELEKNQIGIIDYSEFPDSILDLNDHPLILYFQGEKNILKKDKLVSIVGSREINHYSSKCLTDIISQLEGFDLGIVSGLALGVDSLAHQLALKHNFKCLAFIGSGLDDKVFYPSTNLKLKKQIIDSGGIVCSEYPPGFKSIPYTFPRRNRFVACVSDLTWVVQASQKSGALITAKLALEYGKVVATSPASIFDILFEGNINLIREGAQIVANIDDLLSLLNFLDHRIKIKPANQELDWSKYSTIAKIIYENLSYDPKDIQELFTLSKIPIAVLGSELSLLELAELVSNVEFGKWVKN